MSIIIYNWETYHACMVWRCCCVHVSEAVGWGFKIQDSRFMIYGLPFRFRAEDVGVRV